MERVTLGSLNYDCLLEQAMAELGLATDYMLDDAHPAGSIPLAKIHGSSNFVTMDLTFVACPSHPSGVIHRILVHCAPCTRPRKRFATQVLYV